MIRRPHLYRYPQPSIYRVIREAINGRNEPPRRCHPLAVLQWNAINEKDDPDPEFVNETQANQYKCSICLDIVTNPVTINCNGGHIFCEECINPLPIMFPCPTCRHPCRKSEVRADNFSSRIVGGLMIKCPNIQITEKRVALTDQRESLQTRYQRNNRENQRNSNNNNRNRNRSRSRSRERNNENENDDNGDDDEIEILETCHWIGEYRDLNNHLKLCGYHIVSCDRCRIPVFKQEIRLSQHLCPWRFTQCDRCLNNYITCERHLCPLDSLPCEYCNVPVTRRRMENHKTNICLRKPIICQYDDFGCHNMIARGDMNQHSTQHTGKHLKMVKDKCIELSDAVEELKDNHETLREEHDELQIEHDSLKDDYDSLRDEHDDLIERVDALSEKQSEIMELVSVLSHSHVKFRDFRRNWNQRRR